MLPPADQDEEARVLRVPLDCLIPRFSEMKTNPTTYCSTVRLTTTEVVVTTTTTKMVRDLSKRTLNPMNRLILPSRKQLPSVKMQPKRMNKKLIKERDRFMKKLQRERAERKELETWAANKLQRQTRRFLARPAVAVPYKKRTRRSTVANIRADLITMQSKIEDESESNQVETGDWRNLVTLRARGKRDAYQNKDRQARAATKIQAMVRAYIARIGHHYRRRRRAAEIYCESIATAQRVYRGFLARKRVSKLRHEKYSNAALKIQCVVRGVFGRELAGLIRLEKIYDKNESKAATTLQKMIRKNNAQRQVQHRRESEALGKIENVTRGHLFRRRRNKKQDTVKNDAAIKVQALFRGNRSRSSVCGSIKEEDVTPPTLEQDEPPDSKSAAAACAIQKRIRGYQARASISERTEVP